MGVLLGGIRLPPSSTASMMFAPPLPASPHHCSAQLAHATGWHGCYFIDTEGGSSVLPAQMCQCHAHPLPAAAAREHVEHVSLAGVDMSVCTSSGGVQNSSLWNMQTNAAVVTALCDAVLQNANMHGYMRADAADMSVSVTTDQRRA